MQSVDDRHFATGKCVLESVDTSTFLLKQYRTTTEQQHFSEPTSCHGEVNI